MAGLIYNIQRFSIHDGPGIRTTVFFKGCPMHCPWCHNPESQSPYPQHIRNPRMCVDCKLCESVGEDACPSGSIKRVGETWDEKALFLEITKDLVFFEESGGGVTFSGGEPLMQGEFLLPMLKRCRARGIHTTLDTCGVGNPQLLKWILEYTDLVLFDIKNMNPILHLAQTGIPLDSVLTNLEVVKSSGVPFWIRIPVIPGMNDDFSFFSAIAEVSPGAERICLLPYHSIGSEKYTKLGLTYTMSDCPSPDSDFMKQLESFFTEKGFSTKIGG